MTDAEASKGRDFSFTLFVSGASARAQAARQRLESLCTQVLGQGNFRLKVVDVFEHPAIAERRRILVTPMVIREEPKPERRVVGDLADAEKLAAALGMRWPTDEEAEAEPFRE